MISIAQAIISLRPGAEWSMDDNDVSSIVWHTDGVIPLTQSEVDAEVARLTKVAEDKAQIDAEARSAAIAHAKSLGFTEQMIAVMYPNL